MKKYIAETGIQLDAHFFSHCCDCDQCAAVDTKQSSALKDLCLEGSILFKRENVIQKIGEPEPQSEFHTSAVKARKLMRYKE